VEVGLRRAESQVGLGMLGKKACRWRGWDEQRLGGQGGVLKKPRSLRLS
jgi:hypothetical protein